MRPAGTDVTMLLMTPRTTRVAALDGSGHGRLIERDMPELAAGHVLMRLWYERRLGGYTGDTLGALQQSSEIGLYLGLCAWA